MNYFIKSERIDYNYTGGHDDTIIFLHGWGGDKNSFASTMRLLRQRYNILSITLPTIQNTVSIWQLSDYAELILMLMKIHNIDTPIIICHSFGFRVCSYLNALGVKFKKVIVTGGAGIKNHTFCYSNKNNHKHEKWLKIFIKFIKNIDLFKKIKEKNRKILLQNKKFKYLYQKIASPDYVSLSTTNKETFKNIVNFNTINLIFYHCQLLLFWGQKDSETPLNFAKFLKKYNKNMFFSVNSGHFAYLEENLYFNHCVMEFLK